MTRKCLHDVVPFQVTNQFSVADGDVHVGALVFGSYVYSSISLGRDSRGTLIFDILTLNRIRGGNTQTDKAISDMRQEFSTNGRHFILFLLGDNLTW